MGTTTAARKPSVQDWGPPDASVARVCPLDGGVIPKGYARHICPACHADRKRREQTHHWWRPIDDLVAYLVRAYAAGMDRADPDGQTAAHRRWRRETRILCHRLFGAPCANARLLGIAGDSSP